MYLSEFYHIQVKDVNVGSDELGPYVGSCELVINHMKDLVC